jgi:hypothetical protein
LSIRTLSAWPPTCWRGRSRWRSCWRATCPDRGFPDALRKAAPGRRRRSAGFSLAIAETAAARHDVVSCAGLLAKAAIEAAQAALAERGEWALNEKAIVRRAALSRRAEAIITAPGDRPFELSRAVSGMRAALGIPPDALLPPESPKPQA